MADTGIFVRDGVGSIADPVSGQTWLFDTSDHTLKAYDTTGWFSLTNNRVNLTAIAYPTVDDDETLGYGPCSLWTNTTDKSIWVCRDGAAGAAVWEEMTDNIQSLDLVNLPHTADLMRDDWVVSGFATVPTTGLDALVTTGVAYSGGNRWAGGGVTQSLAPSKDNYFYLNTDGSLHVEAVNNGAAAPTGIPGMLFQKVVTNATDITTVTALANTATRIRCLTATAATDAVPLAQVQSLTAATGSAPGLSAFVNTSGSTAPGAFVAATTNGTYLGREAGVFGFHTPANSGGGTVNQVAATGDGTIFNTVVTGSPITNSGTLVQVLIAQAAKKVLMGPTGGADAAPTWRLLVAGDLPLVPMSTGVTGVLPFANGGTTGTTRESAADALLAFASVAKGDVAVYDGTHWVKFTHGADGTFVKYDSSTATGLAASAIPAINMATGVTGVLPFANGGTTGTTRETAANALLAFASVAKGDIAVFDGTNWVKQTKGANGTYLKYDSSTATGLTADTGAGGGMANPMTTAEDIIYGGASGTPTRKAKGADGTFLGVSAGVLGYYTPPSYMTNPMTTAGDIILGGASGASARKAKGADGTFLGVQAGVVDYYAPPSTALSIMSYSANNNLTVQTLNLITATSGSKTMTLPTYVGNAGKVIVVTMVARTGSYQTQVAPFSGQLIDGSSSNVNLNVTFSALYLICDGISGWHSVGQ